MGSGAAFHVHGDLYRTRERRNKRNPFAKERLYYKDYKRKDISPKITEIQLSAIREKIKKQNRKERDKLIISFIIAIPITIMLISGFLKYAF
ncbi:hypothetical protein [Kordia sp.]|uniref:hypothetical protein n=1 Tax=Kordia sp. TaxID=1965332 RepID=UPI0025BA797E|nr:hypothetical protein [Kordia sp.]MCH2196865.1 hypothetical protein [Kordia sp.]